ncbi:MAG: nuclear transport factor 2 family protein [Burkholderiales bacterium]
MAANRAFDDALSRLDIAAIEALSLQESHAMAIHPSARQIIFGWDAVRKSWQAVAERFVELSVKLESPQAVVRDNVGWVSGAEVVRGKRKTGETVTYTALTTNIFEKRDGRWLLSAHFTARLPA